MSTNGDRIVRFGEFEVDKGRRLLRSVEGSDVPLTPRVFDTLLHLVERPGELIDKRELLEAVWPNVVVEENNLTQAISTLRRALGEQPRQHRYIATVPGRGYRFVADVRTVAASESAARVLTESGSTDRPPDHEHRTVWYVAIAVAVIAATWGAWRIALLSEVGADAEGILLTDQRLVTELHANNRRPTLSRDGSMVAFVSDASGTDQIYVQGNVDGEPNQITYMEGGAQHPSWSPRSDRIVFHSPADGGIWTVGILGSPPPMKLIPEGKNPRYSFDGNTIVYEHRLEIRLADSDGARQRSVPGVPLRNWSFHPMFPALSPDGRNIVFFRQDTGPIGDYWVIPAAGGEARQLTFDFSEAGRASWASDGYVYFPSEREGTRTIWRVPASGGEPRAVTSSAGEDDDPAVSRDATQLAYTNTRIETRFMVRDESTGETKEVYRSRFKSSFPRVSNDGRRIAFFQKSDPEEQLFVMPVDTWEATQLTRATRGERRIMPRWSPDDRFIYYYQVVPDNQWSVQAMPHDGGPSREIFSEFMWATSSDAEWSPSGEQIVYIRHDPLNPSDPDRNRVVIRDVATGDESEPGWPIRFSPSWSQGGEHVLGTSMDEVLICPVSGGACQAVFAGLDSNGGRERPGGLGRYAQWSSDGSRVFFNRLADRPGMLELWIADGGGGNATRLFEYGPVDPLDGRFQVLPGGRILWNEMSRSHHSELWVATLSRSDSEP